MPPSSTPHKTWTLVAVLLGTFMLLVDITIVVVALPDIRSSLHTSFSDVQWTVDAYSLSLAALLLPTGSLADILGRRRVFALGLAVFTLGALLCGLSRCGRKPSTGASAASRSASGGQSRASRPRWAR